MWAPTPSNQYHNNKQVKDENQSSKQGVCSADFTCDLLSLYMKADA